MNNMFQYSNGWGHLIVSIVLLIIATLFVLFPGTSQDVHAIGISLIMTVSGAWFIPGAAKQVLNQVQRNSTGNTANDTTQKTQGS